MSVRVDGRTLRAVALAALVASGCRPDRPGFDEPPPDTLPPLGEVEPAPIEALGVGDEARRRHADALDRLVLEARAHHAAMRVLAPRHALPRMDDHAARVDSLVAAVERELVALGAERPGPAAERLLGMREDHHRDLTDRMSTLRLEAHELRTASEPALRDRLPAHLDRLERLLAALEMAAARLRRR